MNINMISVDSSSISSIGYKRRTMLVKFLTGRTYQYKKVPRLVFDDFVKSSSKGEYFNNDIRNAYLEKEV